MRKILFRGYSKGIGKWIYGCLVKCWSKVKEDFIDDKPMIFSRNNNNYYEIDKDSLGQYTGFKDKTGKEIYEGDIINSYTTNYIIKFDRGCWMVEDRSGLSEFFLFSMSNVEVIDNVYEEKLKEK